MPSTQAKASRRSAKLVALEIHLKAHAAFSAMQGTVWIARSRWSRCRVGTTPLAGFDKSLEVFWADQVSSRSVRECFRPTCTAVGLAQAVPGS